MAKLKLTSAFCREITCTPGRKKDVYRCTEQTGFGIEVRPNGKTYYYYHNDNAGKARQEKLGGWSDIPFESAKRKAKLLRSREFLGEDIAAEKAKRKAVPLYSELARQHLEHARTYQRRPEGTEVILRKYLVPQFGKLRINEITSQSIEKFLAKLRETLAMSSVEKVRITLHRSFHLAAQWDMPGAEKNPLKAVARPRFENKREMYVTAAQAEKLLRICGESANPLLKPIVHLLLLTGARKRELLDAKWEHVDVERRSWLIPDSKSGKSRYVPLSQAAVDVIGELPRYPSCPWLVPNPDTRAPFDNIKHGWDRARRTAGLPKLRIHDLRHSAASFMVNSGVDLYAVGRILGHADHQSTVRYAHVYDSTLLAAAEAGAAKMKLN